MKYLVAIKELMKKFYGKFEVYITPTLKFLLALITLAVINANLGYMSRLTSGAIVVIVALLCSFLPLNAIIIFSALFILAHTFALSLECAAVVAVVFILMLLLYFRFSPKDAVVVVLTPICMALKIPYVMPLAMGLVGTPASAVSVGCGVIVYYVLQYIAVNAETITSLGGESDSILMVFAFLIDGLLANKAMLVCALAFAACVVVVYVVRMLSIDYSWFFAMAAGALTNLIILFAGDLAWVTNVKVFGAFLGTIVSVIICLGLQFFVFNVDYNRTENLQFEDDEYYYYVKAVPKVAVGIRDITAEQKAERARNKLIRTSDEEDVKTYSRKK